MIAIRDARFPADRAVLLSFINGSQAYEAAFESNRRLDDTVASEHLDVLLAEVRDKQGRMFAAEDSDGRVIGWACCSVQPHGVFVAEDLRMSGYVNEVYVDSAHRGRHIGRQLIAACEDHFRTLGLKTIFIGVLAGNTRAIAAYDAAGFRPYALEMRKHL